MPVKLLKLKIKETICIFHYLNKLSVLRVCPGVLFSLPLSFISVATEVPRLSWPQYPGHRVVTEPGLALHHQHVTWPRRARVMCHPHYSLWPPEQERSGHCVEAGPPYQEYRRETEADGDQGRHQVELTVVSVTWVRHCSTLRLYDPDCDSPDREEWTG